MGRILELEAVGRWRHAIYDLSILFFIYSDIDLSTFARPHKTHSDPSRGSASIPPQDSDLEEENNIKTIRPEIQGMWKL
jgi:hypothetical protein